MRSPRRLSLSVASRGSRALVPMWWTRLTGQVRFESVVGGSFAASPECGALTMFALSP